MAYELTARIRLIDNATDPLQRFQRQMQLTGSVGTSVFSGITSSVTRLAGAIGIAAAAWKTYDIAMDSVKKAMDFEAQMSSIQALTGATNDEMRQMSSLALKMGAQTKYSALEAARGIEELLKSGLSPAQIQTKGLEAALNLATAGGLDLADAAEIMATALNSFKRDAITAAEASNILAGTANASATSVQELRYSLAAVSAVASGVGLSFKDTNTALGLFANNGIKGSDAGTSLKTMLSNLQPTTKQQIALFKRLGILTADGANQFFNAKGQLKDLKSISDILRKSLGKMTDQQRMLAFEMMFGSDAIRAANILYKEGADGVEKFQREMSKVSALDVAKKKMDNAKGAVEQFQGALETLQISALTPLMPAIKNLALASADLVEKYGPRITAAVTKAVNSAQNYLNTHFFNNPAFKQLPTISQKIEFIWNDLMDSFNQWLSNGGNSQISQAARTLTSNILSFIESELPVLVPRMIEIGSKLGYALLQGINDELYKSDLVQWFMNNGALGSGKRLVDILGLSPSKDSWIPDVKGLPFLSGNSLLNTDNEAGAPGTSVSPSRSYTPHLSGNAGRPSVANNYVSNIQVTVNGANMNNEVDAERLAKRIAREISRR